MEKLLEKLGPAKSSLTVEQSSGWEGGRPPAGEPAGPEGGF